MKLIKEPENAEYAIENLQELDSLMSHLDTIEYSQKLEILSRFSIGSHIRHILEFYNCVLFQKEEGTICYDKRERNLILETDISYARKLLEEIVQSLASIGLDFELILKAGVDHQNDSSKYFKTTLRREIYYCFEHSIHHQALIKIGLIELGKSERVNGNFGIAPSTIKHLKEKQKV